MTNHQTVLSEIKAHIRGNGNSFRAWYAGITNDPKRRVFDDHKVSQSSGVYIWRKCLSTDTARSVETSLISAGTDGGDGGGRQSSQFVYAYKKSSYTREKA